MVYSTHRIFFSLIVLLFVIASAMVLHAEEVQFSYAILQDTEAGPSPLDFSTPPRVDQNTTLQIYLQPEKHTFVYLFLLDSSNFFSPIFPTSRNYYDDPAHPQEIRIPEGQNRFTTLPPAGQERFYLIASPDRLPVLEEMSEKCLFAPNDVQSQAELFSYVRSLRRQHSQLTQYTEKGMPVSGTMRNLAKTRGRQDTPQDFEATRVEANGFYSRILRLNHD